MTNAKLFLMTVLLLAISGAFYYMFENTGVTGAATGTKCTDSDGGINIYVKGTAVQTTGRNDKFVTDMCSGTTQVIEAYCSKNKATTTTKSCSTGYICSDGACTKIYACNDGIDNDGDGKTDYPNDPGCASSTDNDERTGAACDDGSDNDGDGKIDMNDAGCSSVTDNDEANCGDGAVSGSEQCDGSNLNGNTCASKGYSGGALSCTSSCTLDTTGCYTDTCSDTDGGFVTGTQGTVSGSYQGNSYSNTDSCSGTVLTEYYCSGGKKYSSTHECNKATNQSNNSGTTTCSSGACQ